MWSKTYSVTTDEVTREQMWKLFTNVNSWHIWDSGVENAQLNGQFEQGNHILLKPKSGPKIKIVLSKVVEKQLFITASSFPLGKIYHQHLFEETSDGLRISYTITVKGVLSFLWVKLIAQNLFNSISKDVVKQINIAKTL
jgi:hypothetical protein